MPQTSRRQLPVARLDVALVALFTGVEDCIAADLPPAARLSRIPLPQTSRRQLFAGIEDRVAADLPTTARAASVARLSSWIPLPQASRGVSGETHRGAPTIGVRHV
ncbi:hypothetical protein BE20_01185 [Sorangium cellulosum]|nr:hypothetical protein BE20_01185 [Sorangium cellulosum]